MAVQGRRPVFADPAVAAAATAVLTDHARVSTVTLYAWCVMPDHVHCILSPTDACDVITFVGQFKNLAQRAAWRCGVAGRFWQVSFWDHFLRQDEQLETLVRYVLENPVRAGLAAEPEQYAFCGAIVPVRWHDRGA